MLTGQVGCLQPVLLQTLSPEDTRAEENMYVSVGHTTILTYKVANSYQKTAEQ